jgi:DNA-binding winged helix-turn-helix (wHTH) protein
MNMEMNAAPVSGQKPDIQALSGHTFPGRCARFGVFQLDLQKQELRKDGVHLKVQGKVYQALITLLESPGEIVTREALRTRMWPRDTGLNYDANVNTTVNKLRSLLGDTSEQAKFIETIPRRGYSFIAKVDFASEPETVVEPERDSETESSDGFAEGVTKHPGKVFASDQARVWFTAGVVALLISAMLFGAAITLYSHHRPF